MKSKIKKSSILLIVLLLSIALFANEEGFEDVNDSRPFWGDANCETYGEVYGGFSDAPCYQDVRCKEYRFWIWWGTYDDGEPVEVPCP